MSRAPSWKDPRYAEARALHARAGPIDLHLDSILQHRLLGRDLRRRHRAGIRGQPLLGHADVPRLLEGGFAGACLGIVTWPRESDVSWRELCRQVDYLDRLCALDARCLRVRSAADWERARASGRLALAPGIEGAHPLAGRIERVEALARRHPAYVTLTHFTKNAAATPSFGRGANAAEGLTAFGRDLVRALGEHGIAVDVAHVSRRGVLEVCELSTAPVLCSHTGVRARFDHPRNLDDEAIDAVAATGGVIGIYLSPTGLVGRLGADSEAAADHLCHVIERVGAAHAALGSDLDGFPPTILSDHRDCRDVVKVTDALLRRGLPPADVEQVLGGNVRRVFAAVCSASRPAAPPT
jgi:membrane dipeptidase